MWLAFQILLLLSTFSSVLARSLFERQQCAVPCGAAGCGLAGDTCCTTPDKKPNLCGYGTTCCFYGCCNFGSICLPNGSCVEIFTTTSGGKTITSTSTVGAPPPPSTVTIITTLSSGKTITLTSTIGAPGTSQGPPPNLTTITTVSGGKTVTLTSTIGPAPTSTTQAQPAPGVSTQTLPGGVAVTSASGTLHWSTFTVPVPTGLSTTAVVVTDGETFTFLPTLKPQPTQTGVSTETFPGGLTVTSSSGALFWSGFTLPVPTGLSTTAVITAGGATFTFLPTVQPNPTQTGGFIETLPDGVLVTSSSGTLFWSKFSLPVPTGTTTVVEGSETFIFPFPFGRPTTTTAGTTTTTGALITYLTWPPIVNIIPVQTSVSGPTKQDGKPVIPCKAWFFFICISWKLPDLTFNIGGWELDLPPGIYPPGPPPGLKWPPGITLPGPLPPWPPLTIGNDEIPTYSDEPTSCKTESATMFLTTTEFAVTASKTTATQVLSTSSIIVGCDVKNEASTTTTTSACPSTASTCSGIIVTMTDDGNDPDYTALYNADDPLATSVQAYLDSIWSDLDTGNSPTTTTTTNAPPTLTTTTTAPIKTAPSWTLSVYNTACAKQAGSAFSYYTLHGYDSQSPSESCFSLKQPLPLTSITSNACQFFNNGPKSAGQICSAGTFINPTSFNMENGVCTIYSSPDCSSGKFDPPSISSFSSPGCTDITPQLNLPENWVSMQCFAYPPH